MMRKVIVLAVFITAVWNVWGVIKVSDVKVFSGHPWKEVVIGYTIEGSADYPKVLEVVARDNVDGKTYIGNTLTGVDFSPGRHVVRWNAFADGARFRSDNVVFSIRIVPPRYCVINLSGGSSVGKYEVTKLADVPEGGWTDDYKASNLVLRLVEAGTFKMLNAVEVTLSNPFYMGVFEVTQRQYELVMGSNPSAYKGESFLQFKWFERPVERVSYNTVRGSSMGSGWPMNDVVDATSFLGKLRAKTGMRFDLPTEAQWEYACRAGTTSKFNNGGTKEDDLKKVGRYYQNRGDRVGGYSQHTMVGSYLPNGWGFYDMHGNISELCLDWRGDIVQGGMDPKGADSGSYRVTRGGHWNCIDVSACTSSARSGISPSETSYGVGFRLALTVQ